MNYIQLTVIGNVADMDTICAVMSLHDDNLVIEDYSDMEQHIRPEFGEVIGEELTEIDKNIVKVSLYLDENIAIDEISTDLEERFAALEIAVQIEKKSAASGDWENEWKKYFVPIPVGSRLLVLPLWEDEPTNSDRVHVKIDPGMAFGTGTHESTKLALSLLDKYIRPNDRVLDVGTGSGILAIAASKLGARDILATDIDPISMTAAQANAQANGVDNIELILSNLLEKVGDGDKFELVTANIVADILIRLSETLEKVLAPNAKIIFSGIINERVDDVTQAMQNAGFALHDSEIMNGWTGLVFEKNEG